ncbi:MAG: alanine dehydrogenase [Bacteroidota bacterium]
MGKSQTSIESELLPGVYSGSWAVPKEQLLEVSKQKSQLKIGIPKETFFQERRVPLTPQSVQVLVANGHQVFIEHNAGIGAHYTDADYNKVGATIKYNVADIFKLADYILKVTPLSDLELDLLRESQTVISAVHLGSLTPNHINTLIKKNITAIGFEFFQSAAGTLPLVQMMSEIAGVSSIHIASELLTGKDDGQGILLGGITGIPPAEIAIIGAGTVGFNAAKTALGMGARVRIIDQEIYKLRRLVRELGTGVFTAVAQYNFIYDAVVNADVVIGAAFSAGSRTPVLVTEDMVVEMKKGSVIIDVAIDQGGCVETSRVTTHDEPTFLKHDVIHFCVPNIPSRVPRSASMAVSNVLGPLLINIGDSGGVTNLMKQNEGLKQGIYIYRHHLTKKSLARMFGMNRNYRDIGLLIATM